MSSSRSARTKRPQGPGATLRLGDVVRFRFVDRTLEGRITEDRGPLAGGGKHLYRVVAENEDERRELELPAEDLEKVA